MECGVVASVGVVVGGGGWCDVVLVVSSGRWCSMVVDSGVV